MAPGEALWPTDIADGAAGGQGITSGTTSCATRLRSEDVWPFLDHSSLAVTTTYLRRLEGQEDRSWQQVAEAIGV